MIMVRVIIKTGNPSIFSFKMTILYLSTILINYQLSTTCRLELVVIGGKGTDIEEDGKCECAEDGIKDHGFGDTGHPEEDIEDNKEEDTSKHDFTLLITGEHFFRFGIRLS